MAILVHFGPFLGLGGVFFLAEKFFMGTHLSFMTLLKGFFTLWSNPIRRPTLRPPQHNMCSGLIRPEEDYLTLRLPSISTILAQDR